MKLFSTLSLLLLIGITAHAAIFNVNTTADTQDVTRGDGICADATGACSLRAAISESLSLQGADTINLPAGTYGQTLAAANEDINNGGDFDIADLTINGAGRGVTIVQAGIAPGQATERVFHNGFLNSVITLSNMTIRYGAVTATTGSNAFGGGIRNDGIMTLNNVEVSSNLGTLLGGGIYNLGASFTINNSFVAGNLCTNAANSCFGGGMASLGGNVTINNSVFFSNSSTSTATGGFSLGGGIYAQNSPTAITGSIFSNNGGSGTDGSQGAGLRFNSVAGGSTMTVEITDTTVTTNSGSANGTIQSGVGIAFNPSAPLGTSAATPLLATLTNVTINNNSGATDGAGIFAGSASSGVVGVTLNLNNCTISGNTASGFGGGMEIVGSTSVVNVSNSTIARNTAGTGGGIDVLSGTVNVRSSIVGDNAGGTAPDISGAIVSGDYNLFENVGGATITGTTTNNIIGVDPQLADLANNGGQTQTHALVATSPAIDKGNSFGLMADQRGATRPVDFPNIPNATGGDGTDIGAYEVQGPTASGVTVSGRVLTPKSRTSHALGVSRATVSMIDQSGQTRNVRTNENGDFRFEGVQAGQTYIFNVISKNYQFDSQVVTVTENLEGLNFIGKNVFRFNQ